MNISCTAVLQEFGSAHGLAIDPEASMLEFEFQGLSVIVGPHPVHADRLIAEVDVIEFDDEPDAGQLSLLLRINEAARFEHEWSIVLDGERRVALYTTAPAALMTIAALEQLITVGIDRALALQSVLDATQDADAADITENDQPAGLPPPQLIRG
jgi:hypothetical protein